MSYLSVCGSCTADLSFGASSPETLLGDTCSRAAMVPQRSKCAISMSKWGSLGLAQGEGM